MSAVAIEVGGKVVRIANGDEIAIPGTTLKLRVVAGGTYSQGNQPPRLVLDVELVDTAA